MEMDPKTIELLRSMTPRQAYETVRDSVLRSPWGASSEDMQAAMTQAVDAGVLTWDQIEAFEES
jgi:hypothetical protein